MTVTEGIVYNCTMRQIKYFEAYLDDFRQISIYMSKQSYEGVSRQFYLQDDQGAVHELAIQSIAPTSRGYNKYVCLSAKDIEIGKEYQVLHQFARSTPLKMGYVVKRKDFDERFAYLKDDLGATYSPYSTTFVLWAPAASQVLLKLNDTILDMNKEGSVFKAIVMGDYHLAEYLYYVKVDGEWKESIDPYGKSSSANTKASVVIDESRIQRTKVKMPITEKINDAIIYECSVRDFTSYPGCGVTHQSQYLGMVEENKTTIAKKTGFSYLKELGITHIQLMPILDFASVDENNPALFYNWGYDPAHYMSLEGSYSSNAHDPLKRMEEFIVLVDEMHKAGIKVVVDVVFNHVYELDTNPLQLTTPNYFFQMDVNGHLSNGSWCGNDYDSNHIMARKYLIDCCKRLLLFYDVDGFRFDLMGIIDIDTMNEIRKECAKIKSDILIYGEGWDMPSFLAQDKRSSILNDHKIPMIGHFSDRFRDVVKGKTDMHEVYKKGYCSGDVSLIHMMKDSLTASVTNQYVDRYFDSPLHVINYVECHDNQTCWDKLKECCKEDTREKRIQRQKLCIAAVMFAQGTPFIHSGQEFARTKYGKHNTYNNKDDVNWINYDRKDTFQEIVDFTKACIQLRKQYNCFKYDSVEKIKKYVSFKTIQDKVLIYDMKDEKEHLQVIFNPTNETFEYELDTPMIYVFNEHKICEGLRKIISIDPLSVIVLKEE